MNRRDLNNAVDLWEGFRETPASKLAHVTIPDPPDVVMILGTAQAIEYATTHGTPRKSVLYRHDFAPSARPFLGAGKGRGELYFVGGRFRVTAHGITDYDARGRVIDYTPPHRCPHCGKPST